MDLLSVKQRYGIIGNSERFNSALEMALRVAPTDLSVLVTGESGVGKEFFPQIIHDYSPRKHGHYIAVNCGAIPEGTIDSELFGHEKGAFTGATEARKGYFEEADGGTIFLDEVAELPHSTQVRLLRVLQTGEFIRVGSAKVQKTDVRVVAATNSDLQKAIDDGKFREDLYYRLCTIPIIVPPLRERRQDIHLLFRKFSSDIAVSNRMPAVSLDEGARRMLEEYHWKGNIRQLKSVAERLSVLEESRLITADTLRKYLPDMHSEGTEPMAVGADAGYSGSASEREILYNILFDMRKDMNDVKRMLLELLTGHSFGRSDISGLLPSPIQPEGGARNQQQEEPEIADSEDVTDQERPATREQMQREAIVKALRKHNGKRKDAARELFMSERTLYRKIRELGITE